MTFKGPLQFKLFYDSMIICQDMTIYSQVLLTKHGAIVSSFLCICGCLCKFKFCTIFSLNVISSSEILQYVCPFISCSHSCVYRYSACPLPIPMTGWDISVNYPICCKSQLETNYLFIFHGSRIIHKNILFLLLLLLIQRGHHLSALMLLLIQHTWATSGFWSSPVVPAYISW